METTYLIFLDNRDFEQGSLDDHIKHYQRYSGTPDFWDSGTDILHVLQDAKEACNNYGCRAVVFNDTTGKVIEQYEPDKIAIKDIPDHFTDLRLTYSSEGLIKERLDLEEMIRWFKEDQTEYEKVEADIRDYERDGDGWNLFAWHDASGWDYWVNREKESNYIQITVEFENDSVPVTELDDIKQAIEQAREHFSQHDIFSNPEDYHACEHV